MPGPSLSLRSRKRTNPIPLIVSSLPNDALLDVAHIRNSDTKVVTLRDNLVRSIIPASTAVDIVAEVVQGPGRHVAELLLGIGNKALAFSTAIRVAELGSRVVCAVALEDARIVLEDRGQPLFVGLASWAFRPFGRGIRGEEIPLLDPVINAAWVVLSAEVHRGVVIAVVAQRFTASVVFKLRPVDLESGGFDIAVAINPGTVDRFLILVDARNACASIVP